MYKQTEAKFENTIFEARVINGKILSYIIRPQKGYKLHEITLDVPVFDKETMQETAEIKKREFSKVVGYKVTYKYY